jgi:hypothetical protein
MSKECSVDGCGNEAAVEAPTKCIRKGRFSTSKTKPAPISALPIFWQTNLAQKASESRAAQWPIRTRTSMARKASLSIAC